MESDEKTTSLSTTLQRLFDTFIEFGAFFKTVLLGRWTFTPIFILNCELAPPQPNTNTLCVQEAEATKSNIMLTAFDIQLEFTKDEL